MNSFVKIGFLELETKGYHIVEDRDNIEEIIENGPFPTEDKDPYLGFGIYFWDNNLSSAKWWGDNRYKGKKYLICEADLDLIPGKFLDLVGDMGAINYFRECLKKFKRTNWTLGQAIEFLKDLNNTHEGIFPYKSIRAVDLKYVVNRVYFTMRTRSFTSLNPVFIICVMEKDEQIKNFSVLNRHNK